MMHEIEKHALADKLMREVWQNYQEVFGNRLPEYPRFETGSKGIGAAGYYYSGTKTVWINLAYYHGGDTSALRETIAHELAHHIAEHLYPKCKQWHGPEFKYVMQQIGYDGNTFHAMSVGMAKKEAKKDKDDLFDLS